MRNGKKGFPRKCEAKFAHGKSQFEIDHLHLPHIISMDLVQFKFSSLPINADQSESFTVQNIPQKKGGVGEASESDE